MKFNILVNDNKIREACSIVALHCQDTAFLQLIQKEKSFNHTDLSPGEVAVKLAEMPRLEITVTSYKPFWRFSKAIAYASGNTIYFNSYKDMPLADRVETIFHEATHLLGFSHKGNRVTEYNLNTVPYKAARIFIKYLKEKGDL